MKRNGREAKSKPEFVKIDGTNGLSVRVRGMRFDLSDGRFTIYGCRLRENNQGELFISYPSYKGKDGDWYHIANCFISKTEELEAILAYLDKVICDG